MTIAFAITRVKNKLEEIDVWAGCDSLSGGRNTIHQTQKHKYLCFEDLWIAFSGQSSTTQSARRVLPKMLSEDRLRGETIEEIDDLLINYYQAIAKLADKRDQDAGSSGVETLIVSAHTGDITTILPCGSIAHADTHVLPCGTMLRYAAIGSGAPFTLGAIDTYIHLGEGGEAWLGHEQLQAILKSACRHTKGCGGTLRSFTSTINEKTDRGNRRLEDDDFLKDPEWDVEVLKQEW